MATASSPAPVVARVRVPDAELDVLFLVTQYLRDLGLSTTVVALLRESGLDPSWLCGPSRELALLREWVFQGEWPRVRALLGPLRDVLGEHGLAAALARVDKQALLEEFHLAWTAPRRRREIVEQLQQETSTAARLTKQDIQRCMQVLRDEPPRHECVWSLDEARLGCFESLVPLFRDAVEDDDDEHKYLTMPRRQLVALLNDALLLQRQQSGSSGALGSGRNVVGVMPISADTLGTREDEPDRSSLRLVEPDQMAGHGASRNTLSQSVDLTRYVGIDLAKSTGRVSKPTHARNPLVMSMAFPSGRPRDGREASVLGIGQEMDGKASRVELEDENHEPRDTESSLHASRSVEDAETQTESILCGDQVIEAAERPAASSKIAGPPIQPGQDKVSDSTACVPSNQTTDARSQQVPIRSSSVFRASKTETVVAGAPLEAWCTSRRGEILQQDEDVQQGKPIASDPLMEPQIDTEGPGNDGDKNQAPDADDDGEEEEEEEEPANAPLRSYSQLTIDSVVRASVIAEVREAQAIRAMDIAPDGSELVIGTNARALRVFDLTEPLTSSSSLGHSGGLSFLPLLPVSLERHKHHASSIYTACYNHVSPAHAAPLIATGAAESSIKVLARWTQQEVWIRGHSGKSRALCFASPNVLCSAASGDMVIRVWDVDTSSSASGPPCVQHFDGHVGEIQAMAIAATSPQVTSGPLDRRCFVSASMDRTVRLWDLRSAQCARVLARTALPAFALAFQPHSSATTVLATGHQDGSVSLWDLRTSSSTTTKALATVLHHQDECRAVSWSPDGQWLLSASFDGTVCVMEASGHDINAVASFHQHEDKILQAQWHPTQPAIVTTGADKLVKLWAFT